MKPSIKWSLIVGGAAAVLNLATAFATSLCGILVCPIAAGLASYLAVRDDAGPSPGRVGAQVGGVTGAVGAIGLLIGSAVSALFWNAPLLMMAVASMRDMSDLGMAVTSSAAGALFIVALALVVSLVSIALSIGAGAIVARIAASMPPSTALPTE